jgi:PAS domain S-box-containing protein
VHSSFESKQDALSSASSAAAILESITDAFFSLNTDWEFTYVNRQAEEALGVNRNDLLGKSIWDMYPGLAGSEFEEIYRNAARDQVSASVTSYFPDHQRWYEVHVYPAGTGISIYFRNVTERVHAEEKLRESELRFRLMADSIPQIVWIADATGRAIFFNQQWNTYTGIPVQEKAAEEVSALFIHPDDNAHTIEAWNKARQEGRIFNIEHRIRSASGEYRWFLVRAEPYRDPGTGKIVRWFGTSTDVHDRKLAEAALKRSEARYQALYESIDEGFCIVEMMFDQNGDPCDYRFCEINPMFEQQTGLRRAAGKTMRELAPEHERHWFEIYGKVAVTGKSIRFENEAKALNRWFDVFAFRIDEPGAHRVAILFRDITGKKRIDEALRKSERRAVEAARQADDERYRLNAVLEAAPVGIVVSEVNGAVLLANAAHRRLWGKSQPSAQSISEFGKYKGWWADGSDKHGRHLEPDEWATARVLRGAEAPHDIVEIESFDATPVRRIVLISGAPIKDSTGKIVGAVAAQMDITDRVKAEEALRQADRRKDEFLAMLAHELRNPLAPIAAAADLLELGRLDETRVKQSSAIISRQVTHMTGLVDDLLDVSRVTRGLVTLSKARLDAKRIVSDGVEQVRPLIEARRHRLAVHTPPESAFVMGDQKRLVQVMTNLLNNSAKYTPEGGDIVLSMEVDGDHVKMVVTDNGIGMAPELVERAFELFAQAERTPDRSQGGLGIGLALVKSLMDLHDGSVTAHSDGLGKGSRFTICLPHLAVQAGVSDIGQKAVLGATPAKALKVMVVDDNADVAHMLAMFIEALGHQVFVEHRPGTALERARVEMPAVCLLDIGLPDMDGNELARRLRAQPETANAILVSVTGYGQEQDRHHAVHSGFDHHFVKPVDSRKLASLLSKIEGVAADS